MLTPKVVSKPMKKINVVDIIVLVIFVMGPMNLGLSVILQGYDLQSLCKGGVNAFLVSKNHIPTQKNHS
jgi:hypothetical protein